MATILEHVDDELEKVLGLRVCLKRRDLSDATLRTISQGRPRNLDIGSAVENMYKRIEDNWGNAPASGAGENWRWERQTRISPANRSPEIRLARAIATFADSSWVNHIPTGAGLSLRNGLHNGDRCRAVDLAHSTDPLSCELVELKTGPNCDSAVLAAAEILVSGLLYIFSHHHPSAYCYNSNRRYVRARTVHLRVLAPAHSYAGRDFRWLEQDLNEALTRLLERIALPLKVDFRFQQLPDYSWSDRDHEDLVVYQTTTNPALKEPITRRLSPIVARILTERHFTYACEADDLRLLQPEIGHLFIETSTGVRLFKDWREAVAIDCSLPAIRGKADPTCCAPKDMFSDPRSASYGLPKVCSLHSEDRLTWIFFRTLERTGRTSEFLQWCFPDWSPLATTTFTRTLYWGRAADDRDIDRKVSEALATLEPYQHSHPNHQHTETDAATEFSGGRVMIEAKVGAPPGKTGWEGAKAPRQYRKPMYKLLKPESQASWETILAEFYQPMRNLMLGHLLERNNWADVGLLLIVNARVGTPTRLMYENAIRRMKDSIVLAEFQLVLRSWDELAGWLLGQGPEVGSAITALRSNPLLGLAASANVPIGAGSLAEKHTEVRQV